MKKIISTYNACILFLGWVGGSMYQFLQHSHTLYLEAFSLCYKTKLIDASSC